MKRIILVILCLLLVTPTVSAVWSFDPVLNTMVYSGNELQLLTLTTSPEGGNAVRYFSARCPYPGFFPNCASTNATYFGEIQGIDDGNPQMIPFNLPSDVTLITFDIRVGSTWYGGQSQTGGWWIYNSTDITPTAIFSATPLYGVSPVTIQFIDLSTNSPTNWLWTITNNFDSSVITNTTQNPSITFYDQGVYSVSLIAENGYGNDTEIKNDYITVSSPSTPSTKSMEMIGGMNILYFTVIATFLVIVIYLISLFIKVEV